MSIKLKALGLGLIAMMAMGAFAVTNAGATISGHFEFGSEHTFITGEEEGLHFVSEDNKRIGCDKAEYKGTHKGTKTTTDLTITPNWDLCYTTPEPGQSMEPTWGVHENGCHLVFRSAKTGDDATVYVNCPTKAIEITHPNCNITVPTQTVGGKAGDGVTYTTTTTEGAHTITMDVKVKVTVEYHEKLCVFLGTHHFATMEGAVNVTGFSNAAHTVRTGITAT